MFKTLVFLCLFHWSALSFGPVPETMACNCSDITNLQKTGQSGSSLAYAWSSSGSTQCRVWYVRREDGYNSGYFYVSGTSYNFSGLSAGHYTFYFQALCGEELSGFIGIEDVISV